MKKTTLEGLPVLTNQTRKEVLNLMVSIPQIREEWREKFLRDNDELYNVVFSPLIEKYPLYYENLISDIVMSHEMLRRQSEIYGINPELPFVKSYAINCVLDELAEEPVRYIQKSRKEIKLENYYYFVNAISVFSVSLDFGLPKDFSKHCCDYLFIKYNILKKQAQLDK